MQPINFIEHIYSGVSRTSKAKYRVSKIKRTKILEPRERMVFLILLENLPLCSRGRQWTRIMDPQGQPSTEPWKVMSFMKVLFFWPSLTLMGHGGGGGGREGMDRKIKSVTLFLLPGNFRLPLMFLSIQQVLSMLSILLVSYYIFTC